MKKKIASKKCKVANLRIPKSLKVEEPNKVLIIVFEIKGKTETKFKITMQLKNSYFLKLKHNQKKLLLKLLKTI